MAPEHATPGHIVDDKSPICIPFILEHLHRHKTNTPNRPFIIGLNGVQGVGKTTLVRALADTLREQEGHHTIVVSIDDFYLKYEDQRALAQSHPENKLVSCRGEPGTHDVKLAEQFFSAVCQGLPAKIPQYDKSAYSGQGDRIPESEWEVVNEPGEQPVQVVIFEGWCVGFKSLSLAEVTSKWMAPSRTLRLHPLDHLEFINERLQSYNTITELFDAFIHIDAQDTEWVYDWRLEQEVKLRRDKGAGMTDEQVVKFVDAYYPAYELFVDNLRCGVFADKLGCQLRLVVGRDRMVQQKIII